MLSLTMSVHPSVRPSVVPSVRPSVRPLSVEITLERSCTIIKLYRHSYRGSGNACLKGAIFRNSNCKLQVYAI